VFENKEDREPSKLGIIIKSFLKEHSLSMRKLSVFTEIDTATLSRIINGKQPANFNHLQKLAPVMNIPIEQLLSAAGYDIGNSRHESDIYNIVDNIQEFLKSSELFDQQYTTDLIEKELYKYEQYAQTDEGQRIIREDFQAKVIKVSGVGPFIDQLKQMHRQFCTDEITPKERAIIGSALIYFILSTDIIPDYIFPIGYLDDAIAVSLVLKRLSQIKNMEPPTV